MTKSLEQFAKDRTKKVTCAVCLLQPEILAEINKGHEAGLGHTVIREWLINEVGIKTVTFGMLATHKQRGHNAKSS